jgi:hypothetical protein
MRDEKNQIKYTRLLAELMRTIRVDEPYLLPEDQKLLWKKIVQGSFLRKRIQPRRLWYMAASVAASLLLLFGAYFYNHSYIQNISIDYQAIVEKSTVEKQEKVQLVSSGKMLDIEGNNVELVYDKKGEINIPTDAGTEVDVNMNPNVKANATASLNQLIVPYGKTTSVILSDGTKIWVNSGSKLIYPSVFAENKREIYVEGEIYLEVVKSENQPFVVKTNALEINVLGTFFNVSAYKNDENQSVVLVTGSVSVKGNKEKTTKTIQPNQKYTFEKNTNISNVQQVDVFDYICWKYGFLSFKKEKLSAVLKKVERYYNVRMDCDASEIDRTTLSGKLDLKEDIAETFRIISITAPIQYEIQNEMIKISVKP